MPFYDFRCECGNEFNVMARMRDWEARAIACPECGSAELSRIYKPINVLSSAQQASAPECGARGCPHEHVCGNACAHAH